MNVGTSANGSSLSTVHLYPSTFVESNIHTQAFCSSIEGTICYAQRAGLYDYAHSTTVINVPNETIGWNNWGSDDALLVQGKGVLLADTMNIETPQGSFSVRNASVSGFSSSKILLPGGLTYDTQVGLLTLGGTPGYGYFIRKEGTPENVTNYTFPSYLHNSNVTSTDSFGLHYGSASLGLDGSLIYGGYDHKRVIGPVGSWSLKELKMEAPLIDIAIGVQQGKSPFNGTEYDGLLRVNNSDRPATQRAVINPVVPYLGMSPATCVAIAEHLPITLQTDLGLYTWNTDEPQYNRIIHSAAYLQFTFEVEFGNLTIKVPFQLLNLTLEPPIIQELRQYFPCQPLTSVGMTGHSSILGRAFLQSAYVSINWEANFSLVQGPVDRAVFFLAQAPGPGVNGTDVQPITSELRKLVSRPMDDFAKSWAQTWALLEEKEESSDKPSSTPGPLALEPAGSGVTRSTKIAVGVCVPVGILALIGIAWWYVLWKKRHRPPEVPQKDMLVKSGIALQEMTGREYRHEMGPEGLPHEIAHGNERHEVHDSWPYEMPTGSPAFSQPVQQARTSATRSVPTASRG